MWVETAFLVIENRVVQNLNATLRRATIGKCGHAKRTGVSTTSMSLASERATAINAEVERMQGCNLPARPPKTR
jgi:hypothetical protein